MEQITIEQPETADLAPAKGFADEVNAIAVTDKESHGEALAIIGECRRRERAIAERLEPAIKASYQAHKSMTKLRREFQSPYVAARAVLGPRCQKYERDERERAEQERREREQAARKAEEERLLAEAAAAEEAGDAEQAAEILDEAVTIEAPVIVAEPEVAKVEGTTRVTRWRGEVADKLVLIRYIAEHPEWSHLLVPNMPAVNGLARSQRGELRIPGLRAVEDTSYQGRG